MRFRLFFLVAVVVTGWFFLPATVFGQTDLLGTDYGQFSGLGDRDVRSTVGDVIKVVLSFLGVISLVVILYAGFLWMTSGGNEERSGKAKKTLGAAVIGLAIILSAYAITTFVLRNLYKASSGVDLTPVGQTRSGNLLP